MDNRFSIPFYRRKINPEEAQQLYAELQNYLIKSGLEEPSKKKLTKRQKEVYEFICNYKKEVGLPPSRVDIQQRFGFKSPNAAEHYIKSLCKKGWIKQISGMARGIIVVE